MPHILDGKKVAQKLKDQSKAEGWGKSIKQAEKDSAKKALEYFENNAIDS